VLRWSAMGLGAVMLPLAVVAAISTGLRVGQHGFTPARLWAIVFIAIVIACACLYLYALVRGRLGWAARLRPINIRLAIGICIVALVLATPLANFGAISTQSQLARLDSGEVGPADFDWQAMRFDFGPSGIAALQRLKAEAANPETRRLAQAALAAARRYDLQTPLQAQRERETPRNLRIIPAGAQVPDALLRMALRGSQCTGREMCALLYEPGANRAVLITTSECLDPRDRIELDGPNPSCEGSYAGAFYLHGTEWSIDPRPPLPEAQQQARRARIDAGIRQGRIELREVSRRQVFVDGEPIGGTFE